MTAWERVLAELSEQREEIAALRASVEALTGAVNQQPQAITDAVTKALNGVAKSARTRAGSADGP